MVKDLRRVSEHEGSPPGHTHHDSETPASWLSSCRATGCGARSERRGMAPCPALVALPPTPAGPPHTASRAAAGTGPAAFSWPFCFRKSSRISASETRWRKNKPDSPKSQSMTCPAALPVTMAPRRTVTEVTAAAAARNACIGRPLCSATTLTCAGVCEGLFV